MSAVPGANIVHAIVSDDCRRNRTSVGALGEAIDRIWKQAEMLFQTWKVGDGAKFHFVLSVERPDATTHTDPAGGDPDA